MKFINRCPHNHLRGIYGDEINHTPGYRRLQCGDCWRYLDGPVELALGRPCPPNPYREQEATDE